jgi:precorrin-2 dehydrogenase/sirohydrochlorin ferrochelatase
MIPLVHDFTDRTVLVFGGGTVGARKARRFAREAHVVVVSPAFDAFEVGTESESETETETATPAANADGAGAVAANEGDDRADDRPGEVRTATAETWEPAGEGPGVELVRDAPRAADVAAWIDRVDPALVVAATDRADVNEAAATAARDRGVLVNRTDRSGGRDVGSVVVPATVEDGPVTVAVTTGGASPALSKHLRERLEGELAGAGAMADLTRELRAELKAGERSPAERRDAIRRVVRSSRVWKALRTGSDNARRVAADVIRDSATAEGEGGER